MHKPIYILNGPNLNMLGQREPEIYGTQTLADIEQACQLKAEKLGHSIDFRQSNHEGELVSWIQETRQKGSAIIINAGAYTHTSVALLDALTSAEKPAVEIHLSNVFKREEFRHHSYISPAVNGLICGFGSQVYDLGLEAVAKLLGEPT